MQGTLRVHALFRRGSLAAIACACLLTGHAHAQSAGADSLRLHWTAPTDDGSTSAVANFEVRKSSSAILTEVDYALASILPGVPTPGPAGTPQVMRVRGLASGVSHWFCVRSVDAAGNWSGLSNILKWDGALDTAAPQAPANVSATPDDEFKVVRITWRPNTEPDLAGYYVFRSASVQGPWEEAGRVQGQTTEFLDSRLPAAPVLVYQVAAYDARGNVSARSRAVTVELGIDAPSAWRLLPAYPNPARAGDSQRIPVAAPVAATAILEVVDAAESRVRRLEAVLRAPGLIEFQWDGRNDAGRLCAPGVYRAWLLADGVRKSIRLARLP